MQGPSNLQMQMQDADAEARCQEQAESFSAMHAVSQGQRGGMQARRVAHSLAAAPRGDVEVVEQMQNLPEFGSGIGFCPTGKRGRDRPAGAESTAVARSAAALQQRFAEEEEEQQVRASSSPASCISTDNLQWHHCCMRW